MDHPERGVVKHYPDETEAIVTGMITSGHASNANLLIHCSLAVWQSSSATGSSQLMLVGLAGFEPATSATQTRRASQAALQPVPSRV
jgi:hypothetical protein